MKSFFNVIMFSVIAFTLISCGTPQTKDTPSVGANPLINELNVQLAKIPVKGFGYKKSGLKGSELTKWVRVSSETVNKVTSQLPAGYVLQVTGHADASGPEDPEGAKPGNVAISRDRAKTVYDALVAAGVSSAKLRYAGLGSSHLLDGVSPNSPKQRRVSFEVVAE